MAEQTNKRRVTMRNVRLGADGQTIEEHAVDYVPLPILNDYVADARTRWQLVQVSDEPDAGPGGVDGDTDHEAHLKDLSDAALQAAHDDHIAQLVANGEPISDPADAPSAVVMSVEES